MKEYQRALEAYDQGLKFDEHNTELNESVQRCIAAMSQNAAQETDQERLEKAMKDPEVQEILSDPIMRQILNDMQENPAAARDHLKNPMIAKKIQKLMTSGILRMG
jgi:stress-induced-phosphoprotein 1